MDTSIINIIADSTIVQHKVSKNTYLIHCHTGQLLADYVDGKWRASTGGIKLDIDMYYIGNDTDADYIQQWDVIA